ncbi:zinc metalloproteinase nas-13-like [Teleopsis dalmanni]|uniref:zinc metalloproteinase nas-13-like n=1 Tax=Teleopsis dalmanni TaxID=139649 RepID=UPI0018CEA314|nr:zinc metalloproteinase nas-13-like [Teleopsis dalmanni]
MNLRQFVKLQLLLIFLNLTSIVRQVSSKADNNIEDFENFDNEIDVNDQSAEAKTRNAMSSPFTRWPNRTIVYKISQNYTNEERQTVRKALDFFNKNTCLNLREYSPSRDGSRRYLHFTRSDQYCGTRVGYNPLTPFGPHDLTLTPKCLQMSGIIQHETMHAIGLFHEQSRTDRDEYVEINYDNIPRKFWPQFMKSSNAITSTYNISYDYNSMMHYSQFAFAIDPNVPTILARDGEKLINRTMGQIIEPSVADLTKIRIMYNCPKD